MHSSFTAASISLLFATTVWAANPSPMNLPQPSDAGRRTVTLQSTEPEAAAMQVGWPAPMFSFLGADGRWHRSDELLSHGPVLVMFRCGEADLVAVQKLMPVFNELGVKPVGVLDMPTRGTSALSRKLGLSVTLVSDPMSAIAGLYHTVDSQTGRYAPSFFVIDSKRTLRAMYYGPLPPPELLLAAAARGLGRPLPQSIYSSSDDR